MEVFVKDKILVTADGKEDYYKKFHLILQSFIERNVHGFHTLNPNANYTIHHDGSVTINLNYIMYEQEKDNPKALYIYIRTVSS